MTIRTRIVLLSLLVALLLAIGLESAFVQRESNDQLGLLSLGDPDQGVQVAKSNCMACHGMDGNGADPQYPKLAGQNLAYLYRQLWAFKKGARLSDVMSGIVAPLSDKEMADVASYYSRQPIHPDPVKDAQLALLGKRIFYSQSVTPLMTPTCAACHASGGPSGGPMMMGGMGMMGRAATADVPNVFGQHAKYTLQQLGEFATGKRPATVMGPIAAHLGETEKHAVAEYLSTVR